MMKTDLPNLCKVLQVEFLLYQLRNSVCVNSAVGHLPLEYLIQYMGTYAHTRTLTSAALWSP